MEVESSGYGTIRVLGLRELATGAAILLNGSRHNLKTGIWGRVAGDVVDTVMLARAAGKTQHLARFMPVAASVLAIGAIDFVAALHASQNRAGN